MGVVRLLLAIAVLLTHAQTRPPALDGFLSGVTAVEVFFTISGFYMALVLSEKYTSLRAFYLNRLLRIYPAYWLVLALTVIAALVGGWPTFAEHIWTSTTLHWDGKALLWLSNLTLIGADAIMFLYPGPHGLAFSLNFWRDPDPLFGYQAIVQSWSLPLELAFYAIAPFIVRSRIKLVALVIVSLALRWWVYHHISSADPWNYRFLPLELAHFGLGALAYHAYRLCRAWNPELLSGLAVIATGSMVLWIVQGGTVEASPLGRGPLFVIFLAALPFVFHGTRNNRLDRWVGELSYPFYLTHTLVLRLCGGEAMPAILYTLALSAVIGLALHYGVEARFKRRPVMDATPAFSASGSG